MAVAFINSDTIPKNYIHDICHNILPTIETTKTKRIMYDFYTLIPIILFFGLSLYHKKYKLIYEFSTVLIILNLLRPLFYVVTIFPDPSTKCENNCFSKSTNFYEVMIGSCRDMIFSGHISNSFMGLLFLMQYFNMMSIFTILHQSILILWMLCQKRHYTIDIIIAYLVTIVLFDKKKSILEFLNM